MTMKMKIKWFKKYSHLRCTKEGTTDPSLNALAFPKSNPAVSEKI